jgi:hypothetical protein
VKESAGISFGFDLSAGVNQYPTIKTIKIEMNGRDHSTDFQIGENLEAAIRDVEHLTAK